MLWPVINPLSRYRNAIRQHASADPPAWSNNMKERHDVYWRTEAAMAEGNPMLALERGEPVVTPPALWVQGRPDPVHDYHDPDFGVARQRAGTLRRELSQGGRHDRACRRRTGVAADRI